MKMHRSKGCFGPNRGRAFAAALAFSLASAAAPADAVNLEALDLHITQSIQNSDNSVRVVQGRSTTVMVRASYDATPDLPVAIARLAAYRTAPGPHTYLGYLEDDAVLLDDAPSYLDVGSVFRFNIPKAWTTGTVQFVVVVDFPDALDETNETDNVVYDSVTFEPTPPVRIREFNVQYPTGSLPRALDHLMIASWLRHGFPTSGLSIQQETLATQVDWPAGVCNCPKDANQNCIADGPCSNAPARACDEDLDCGCGWLNEMLAQRRQMDSVLNKASFDPDRRYVALVYDDGGFLRGCSPGVSQKVAAGPTGFPSPGSAFDWDIDGSYGDWYTAHELGHAYGRPHAACCGALPNPGDPVFPIAGCSITTDDSFESGYDRVDNTRAWGEEATDVMSYCDNQWISRYTFEALLDRIQLEAGEPLPPLSPVKDVIVAVGNVNEDLGIGRFSSVLALPGVRAPVRTPSGDYAIVLKDSTGGELVRHEFAIAEYYDDRDHKPFGPLAGAPAHRKGMFAEVVDLPATPVAELVLERLGTPIATRTVSANAPTVTVTTPNGGEALGRSVTVAWTASDPDGDPLLATVLYSADDGASWRPVAGPLEGSSVDVDLAGIPGSPVARFRVIVSDGFLSAEDDSDDVATVENGNPQVTLISPKDAEELEPAVTASLEGIAVDAEDGDLAGESLVWSSDRQGLLGTGESLPVVLAPGTHVVTLTAVDSDGSTSSSSVTVVVGDAAADACPAAPRFDCESAEKSLLGWKDAALDTSRRRLQFQFGPGSVDHDASVFGAPDATTAYAICLYEAGVLREALAIDPGASWTSTGGGSGFSYASETGAITKLKMKAGTVEKMKPVRITTSGAGPSLPARGDSLELPVTVQVVNDASSTCFGAEFGPGQVRRNEPGAFKAR